MGSIGGGNESRLEGYFNKSTGSFMWLKRLAVWEHQLFMCASNLLGAA